jgi:hypothetical protein
MEQKEVKEKLLYLYEQDLKHIQLLGVMIIGNHLMLIWKV